MSVLIKGMEMPKNCNACRFAGYGGVKCELNVCMFTGHNQPTLSPSRLATCPLIEIPPHGRLIDADALDKKCEEIRSFEWNNKAVPYSWAYAYESFQYDIKDAPTIIEAEPCNDLAKPNNDAEDGE